MVVQPMIHPDLDKKIFEKSCVCTEHVHTALLFPKNMVQGNQEEPHSSQAWCFSTELCVQTRLKHMGKCLWALWEWDII